MHQILLFSLPQDRDSLTLAEHGSKYWGALWELQRAIRDKVKFGTEQNTTWEAVQDLFHDILDAEDVNLEEVS